jgi:glycosyltransferase involved in cell wall biosynthesis
MSRAILFCTKASTFVKRDIIMLEQEFDPVDLVIFKGSSNSEIIYQFFRDLVTLPFKLYKYDLVVCWFVGYHSLIPFLLAKLFRIKTVAFLGGTEAHNYPEYNYGNYRKLLYSFATKISLRLSNFIFPVHESLIFSEESFVPLKYPSQGILSFNKNLGGHIEAIYCGFESQNKWSMSDKRPNSFLSVSTNLFGMDYARKGLDTFIMLAENFPQHHFTLVGNGYSGEQLENLTIISEISYNELIDIYIKHQFYVQLSIAEGFPNALAEAMLYGCIPIGSSVFGIPGMIGDTGFVLPKKNKKAIITQISDIIALPEDNKHRLAKSASLKIESEYTFERRSEQFYNIIRK